MMKSFKIIMIGEMFFFNNYMYKMVSNRVVKLGINWFKLFCKVVIFVFVKDKFLFMFYCCRIFCIECMLFGNLFYLM